VKTGIFITAEITGPVGERIRDIQMLFDPRLAAGSPPHITLAGSSGVGAIRARTPLARIRNALEPVAAATAPITMRFGAPMRFMQTEIVVLPLDPHGPLRALHEGIARSGLPFEPARFTFSPHCTLNFYQTLTSAALRELLAVRISEPVLLDRIHLYQTRDPQLPRRVLELVLSG
jgi:2'-5' RNA ligase